MKYYLGIDGGGTKTKVCIIDENEKMIGISEAGPSSIDTVTNEISYQNFLNPINNINPNIKFENVFAGVGGIVTKHDEDIVERIIKTLPSCQEATVVKAKNDMFNALYSGLLFNEGMALIVGTGSVAFGINHNSYHKCGGWGYKEGDAGSAYDLGKKSLLILVRTIDERIKPSAFTEDLKKMIHINSIFDIVPVINQLWEDRTRVASFAKIVTKHANLNDAYAKQIVDEATDELRLAVNGVYQKLKISNKTIVIVGSLGNAKGYFQDQLHQKIKSIDSDIKIIAPIVDPALGAAIMAKRM